MAAEAVGLWPWSVFVCPRCGSRMTTNAAWEAHMRSHQRLDEEAGSQSEGDGGPLDKVRATQ